MICYKIRRNILTHIFVASCMKAFSIELLSFRTVDLLYIPKGA